MTEVAARLGVINLVEIGEAIYIVAIVNGLLALLLTVIGRWLF